MFPKAASPMRSPCLSNLGWNAVYSVLATDSAERDLEEIREYMRQWKIAHSTGKSQFACKAYTITLHDIGQMTVHIVTTKAA